MCIKYEFYSPYYADHDAPLIMLKKKNYKFSDYTIEPHLYRKYTYIFITFYFTELRIGEFDLLDFDIPYFKLSSRPDA